MAGSVADDGLVATRSSPPAAVYGLSMIEVPQDDRLWAELHGMDAAEWLRTRRALAGRLFEGSFVAADAQVREDLASAGQGVLAFRYDHWWLILPFYAGSLPATPLGFCFAFAPRRAHPLPVRGIVRARAALAFEASLLPRRSPWIWPARSEQTQARAAYAQALTAWGMKAYADAWITPQADEQQTSLAPY